MPKSKNNANKSAKIPKPIKIKKEKIEEDRTLHPMSHYVDDRLELVKQIFGTLKPKTITNLAPEFLKKMEMEEIQELCLNELLGISTKRLLSIINATKCPTDTETSSDSDVNNVEEHVSLEEVSSDSEVENGAKKRTKKKSNGAGRKSKKNESNKRAENNENEGQISVLELLELQARARAIRSQLALEPVTKIEVDSEGDNDETASSKSKERRRSKGRDRKRKSREKSVTTNSENKEENKKSSNAATTNGTASSSSSINKEPVKKIKLKRNFGTTREPSVEHQLPPVHSKAEESEKLSTNIKEEKCSRSASPDVIPLVAEPITLLVDDSTDEDISKQLPPEDNVPLSNSPNGERSDKYDEDTEMKKNRCENEPEDGEIVDEKEVTLPKSGSIEPNTVEANKTNGDTDAKSNRSPTEDLEVESQPDGVSDNNGSLQVANADGVSDSKTATSEATKFMNDVSKVKLQSEELVKSSAENCKLPEVEAATDEFDDDRNDDVISIEGGDLENEMTEHLQDNPANTKATKRYSTAVCKKEETETNELPLTSSREVEEDIISLGSSDDELIKESTESWNSRWLKSSKVSKVLAASRLGKRVRDKIKKSKRSDEEGKSEVTREPSSSYTSKHEDGSMEQYKELLEMRQQRSN